jgi:hypothetical protein
VVLGEGRQKDGARTRGTTDGALFIVRLLPGVPDKRRPREPEEIEDWGLFLHRSCERDSRLFRSGATGDEARTQLESDRSGIFPGLKNGYFLVAKDEISLPHSLPREKARLSRVVQHAVPPSHM